MAAQTSPKADETLARSQRWQTPKAIGFLAALGCGSGWTCAVGCGGSTTKDAGADSGGSSGGACGSQTGLTVIASMQNNPQFVVVNPTGVYWASGSLGGQASVMSAPVCGGTAATLVSAPAGPLGGIAVDATNVYLTNSNGENYRPGAFPGTLMKVPLAGGTPTTLASQGDSPQGLAVDATSVYWTVGNECYYPQFDGGIVTCTGTLMKVPLAGGTPTTLASGLDGPTAIVVDSTSVYWTDLGTTQSDGTVMKVPLGGGTSTTLAVVHGFPTGIAVDAANVYWIDDAPGTVMSVPLDGGTVTTLASGQEGPGGIAVDATNVYWTAGQMVMKVPLGGGTPITLASGQSFPQSIAVDSTSVYWTNSNPVGQGPGSVMKLTPK